MRRDFVGGWDIVDDCDRCGDRLEFVCKEVVVFSALREFVHGGAEEKGEWFGTDAEDGVGVDGDDASR